MCGVSNDLMVSCQVQDESKKQITSKKNSLAAHYINEKINAD